MVFSVFVIFSSFPAAGCRREFFRALDGPFPNNHYSTVFPPPQEMSKEIPAQDGKNRALPGVFREILGKIHNFASSISCRKVYNKVT
jgi:hypothetical protein